MILFTLGFVIGVIVVSSAYEISSQELNCLRRIFDSTNGYYWSYPTDSDQGIPWNFSDPKPCSNKWYGLTCQNTSGQNVVVEMDLHNFNLTGQLPPEFGDLQYLKHIDLSDNNIRGTLPSTIVYLSDLSFLSVLETHISGTLPSDMGRLTSLVELFIGKSITYNQDGTNRMFTFSGTIPSSVSLLRKLKNLHISGTSITGTLPSSILMLNGLTELILGWNMLTGPIPTGISSLSDLKRLVFTGRFSGTIPSSVGTMTSLVSLNLARSAFSGSIPIELTKLTKLKILRLEDNRLTGNVTSVLSNLPALQLLDISRNSLFGKIPSILTNFANITVFLVGRNMLTGSIPDGLTKLSHIQEIDLSDNLLSFTIPSEIMMLSFLRHLNLSHNMLEGDLADIIPKGSDPIIEQFCISFNRLTGTLSSNMSSWLALKVLDVRHNAFSGTLGDWIGQLSALQALQLGHNVFSGSLPDHLYLLNDSLAVLDIGSNLFSSTISESVSLLSSLRYIDMSSNSFTGSLPSSLGRITSLVSLNMQRNSLVGSLPLAVGNLTRLQMLDLSYNSFKGKIPEEFANLRSLQYLLLQHNTFSGRIGKSIDPSTQSDLESIDLSYNLFSGTIPRDIVHLPSIRSFAAVFNCFQGNLPESVCDLSSLEVIALDGYSGQCVETYVKKNLVMDGSYGIRYAMAGPIPWCVFAMENLRTLHLSGVALSAAFPDNLVISPSLVDLSMSFNFIYGTIPHVIQNRHWKNLDLRYNRLTGTLSNNFGPVYKNSRIHLDGNRLAGVIPSSINKAHNLSVLEGNMFECETTRTLPPHDPVASNYHCANAYESRALLWSMPFILCIGAAGIAIVASLFTSAIAREIRRVLVWMKGIISQFDINTTKQTMMRSNSLFLLRQFMIEWFQICLIISAAVFFVALPVWIVLSKYYKMFAKSYLMEVSAAYLSGVVPACTSLTIFTLALILFYMLTHSTTTSHKSRRLSLLLQQDIVKESWRSKIEFHVCIALLMLFNCAVMMTCSMGFVYINEAYDHIVVSMVSFIYAVFELAWNVFAMPFLFDHCGDILARRQDSDVLAIYHKRIVFFSLLTELLNNIMLPFLATIFFSSSCMYHVLMSPDSVVSDYEMAFCTIREWYTYSCRETLSLPVCDILDGIGYSCVQSFQVVREDTYVPPFLYSYTCASSLLSNFLGVYAYMYILIAFGFPLVTVFLLKLRSISSDSRYMVKCIDSVLPVYMRCLGAQLESEKVFDKAGFIISLVSDTFTLMTFCVVYPPLTVLVLTGMASRMCYVLIGIGSALNNASKYNKWSIKTKLLLDCKDTADIFFELINQILLPLVAIAYGLFLFDMIGDKEGFQNGLFLTISMCLVPFVIFFVVGLHKKIFPPKTQKAVSPTSRLSMVQMGRGRNMLSNTSESDDEDGNDCPDVEADGVANLLSDVISPSSVLRKTSSPCVVEVQAVPGISCEDSGEFDVSIAKDSTVPVLESPRSLSLGSGSWVDNGKFLSKVEKVVPLDVNDD